MIDPHIIVGKADIHDSFLLLQYVHYLILVSIFLVVNRKSG
jgi:hypothetical protein